MIAILAFHRLIPSVNLSNSLVTCLHVKIELLSMKKVDPLWFVHETISNQCLKAEMFPFHIDHSRQLVF